MVFSLFGCGNKTPGEKFWTWFQKNEAKIYESKSYKDPIFQDVSAKLKEYNYGIVFELAVEKDGKREFVISADGIKEHFPDVKDLVKAAPKLEKWTVTAFRPRMENFANLKLEYAGKDFDPKKMWISATVEGGKFDLIIYHPEYTEDERNAYISGTYILLDTALGEYDVVTGIRYLDHQKLPSNPKEEGLLPFSELRDIFDKHKTTQK